MSRPTYLLMDFETFSAVDIGKCGSFRYMDDPSFEPLLLAYAFDDEPVKLADFAQGETWPEEFLTALRDPEITKLAWNCAFEREVIRQTLGYTPPEQWLDVMHVAAQCGLPMSLDAAGKALGLGEEQAKMKEGKALIRYFCCPCKPTKSNGLRERNLPEHAPEKWSTFRDYCVRDVEAERTIFELLKRWLPNKDERRFWALDARINERGVRIDRQLAVNAVAMDERYRQELTERAVALTGLENPRSVSQIKTWLADQEGKTFPSLNKKVIAEVVSGLRSDKAREFMAIRSELSKSSTAKYQAMLRSMCSDDHSKGCFQFYGANRTGRFAGRLVQFQNMSKNYAEDLDGMRRLVRDGHYTALKAIYGGVADPLSQLVRTAIIPEEGHRILVADFSAIEARVTAWFAGEEWRLQTFRDGGDIYCASASQMFHVPVVKHGVNGELRQKGKVAELALGYGGGVNALKAFGADKMGMSDEEMQETVDLWRESSPKIVELWRSLEKAAIRCVARNVTTESSLGHVRFDMEQGILWMTLPSGRRLAYVGAKYEESKYHPDRKSLTYMGVEQQTRHWGRLETWGGKLVENCWAAGTPVLTKRGWVPIETVTHLDEVWDGEAWVQSLGSEWQCRDEILFELDGLLVTGDHQIMTTEGWKHAKECNGLERIPVQLPDGFGTERPERRAWKGALASALRLRNDQDHGHKGNPKAGARRKGNLVWLQKRRADLQSENDARNVGSFGLRGVAIHDPALHLANAPRLEELRRTRHHGLRTLVEQLRCLLGGHGADLSGGAGPGPSGQRAGILTGKLPLDNAQNQLPEQARRTCRGVQWNSDPGQATRRADGHRVHHTAVPTGARLSVRQTDRHTGPEQPVYDVINSGPKHRYVVLGENGPILVHNCVQATARDILREAMFSLTEQGFDIRAHVHDECICTEPIGGKTVEQMCAAMCPVIPWATGLPLRAEGYEGQYYFKD